jgi:hypothetical protein
MRMDLARDAKEMYEILDYLTERHETSAQKVCYADEKSGKRYWTFTGKNEAPATFDYQLEELRRNVIELEAKGIGQSHPVDFFHHKAADPDLTPVITAVAPSIVVEGDEKPVTLAIVGKNFSDQMQVIVGGKLISDATIYANSLITANVPRTTGTITNANKQTVVPIILATKQGAVFDSTSLIVKEAAKDDSGTSKGNGQSAGNENAISVLLGESVSLNKAALTVETSPKQVPKPTITDPVTVKYIAGSPAVFEITVKGTSLDGVGSAKVVNSSTDAVPVKDLENATIKKGATATQIVVSVPIKSSYKTQTASVALYKAQKPTENDSPLVISQAVSLPIP